VDTFFDVIIIFNNKKKMEKKNEAKKSSSFSSSSFSSSSSASRATDRSIDENDDGEKKTNARSVLTNTLPFSLFLSHPIQQRRVARRNDETRRPGAAGIYHPGVHV
jgi:hypothetical protein|tara:strand:+ start:543 stop:860 length:318 start_codon:yes stop_codon:yes gene_type:complete